MSHFQGTGLCHDSHLALGRMRRHCRPHCTTQGLNCLWYDSGMARRNTPQPLRTKGFVWGKRRVALGVSMRELAELASVSKGMLSLMEAGRLIPTEDEYDRVTAALDERAAVLVAAGVPPVPAAAPV